MLSSPVRPPALEPWHLASHPAGPPFRARSPRSSTTAGTSKRKVIHERAHTHPGIAHWEQLAIGGVGVGNQPLFAMLITASAVSVLPLIAPFV